MMNWLRIEVLYLQRRKEFRKGCRLPLHLHPRFDIYLFNYILMNSTAEETIK